MNEKTRSDFWRECDGEIYPLSEGESRSVLHDGTQCPDCRHPTNVEVLIAWLRADDERRKEIEIASRPTKAGEYVRYEVGEVATIDADFIILTPQNMEVMIQLYPDCLWEPLSE